MVLPLGHVPAAGADQRGDSYAKLQCIRYVRFCGMRHPRECGLAEVRAFVEDLAVRPRLGPSSHNQVIAALAFLSRDMLGQPLGALPGVVRPKASQRPPTCWRRPMSSACWLR